LRRFVAPLTISGCGAALTDCPFHTAFMCVHTSDM